MPNKTVQLPPADLQAQDRAWKDYVRHKFHPKRQGELMLVLQTMEDQVKEVRVAEL